MENELAPLFGPLSAMLLDLYTKQLAITELLISKNLASREEIDESVESARKRLDQYPGVRSLRVQKDANALIALELMLTRPEARP